MSATAPRTTRRKLVVPAYFVINLRGGIDDGRIAYPLSEVAKLMGIAYTTAVDMAHRNEIPLVGRDTSTGPTAA